jgi:hypothetical protein
LNPLLVVGAKVGEHVDVSYTRIFTDTTILNNSRLRGDRVTVKYQRTIWGDWYVVGTFEFDYVTYRQSDFAWTDPYEQKDGIGKLRGGVGRRW